MRAANNEDAIPFEKVSVIYSNMRRTSYKFSCHKLHGKCSLLAG